MLPEKVVHDARPEASPWFWMVVVAALQEDWAGGLSASGSFGVLVVHESSLTSDTSSGNGHNGREVLERHLWDYGSWITGWMVSLGTAGKLCSCVVCDRGLVGAAFDARRWPCLGECHRSGGGSGGSDGGGGVDGTDRVTDRWMDVRLTLVLLKAAETGDVRVVANGCGFVGEKWV